MTDFIKFAQSIVIYDTSTHTNKTANAAAQVFRQ